MFETALLPSAARPRRGLALLLCLSEPPAGLFSRLSFVPCWRVLQLEKVPVPNKFTLCRLAACCSNSGGRLTQDLDWNRLRGLFVLLATRSCESQIWLPVCEKKPQLGPKMAPKLGFQFEAPTWVALYVHTGNPKSRARFRCPELSCFWNPFEFNNN